MVKNINILENRYEICTSQSNYPMGLLASFWDLRCTAGFDVMFTYYEKFNTSRSGRHIF